MLNSSSRELLAKGVVGAGSGGLVKISSSYALPVDLSSERKVCRQAQA
jgi:hypothetical protein